MKSSTWFFGVLALCAVLSGLAQAQTSGALPLASIGSGISWATQGEDVRDESFLVLFNAHHEPLTFRLPTRRFGARWKLELSTLEPGLEAGSRSWGARDEVEIESRSILILRRGW